MKLFITIVLFTFALCAIPDADAAKCKRSTSSKRIVHRERHGRIFHREATRTPAPAKAAPKVEPKKK